MQSASVNIAAMFIGVCACVCMGGGLGSNNGKTTAHQLLFDCGHRGSGTFSTINNIFFS